VAGAGGTRRRHAARAACALLLALLLLPVQAGAAGGEGASGGESPNKSPTGVLTNVLTSRTLDRRGGTLHAHLRRISLTVRVRRRTIRRGRVQVVITDQSLVELGTSLARLRVHHGRLRVAVGISLLLVDGHVAPRNTLRRPELVTFTGYGLTRRDRVLALRGLRATRRLRSRYRPGRPPSITVPVAGAAELLVVS